MDLDAIHSTHYIIGGVLSDDEYCMKCGASMADQNGQDRLVKRCEKRRMY